MKPSEKRLLFGLLGLLFIGVGVIGSDYYFDRRNELLADRTTLENEWVAIETSSRRRRSGKCEPPG